MTERKTIAEALCKVHAIWIERGAPPVVRTTAEEIHNFYHAEIEEVDAIPSVERGIPEGVLVVALHEVGHSGHSGHSGGNGDPSAYFRLSGDGAGIVGANRKYLLFGFACHLLFSLAHDDLATVAEGKTFTAAFPWQRTCFDFFLNQEGRIQKGFCKETYIRRLAENGFTHLEVNGLAYPMALESGPKGETYPMFYTYCPALDQFVYSALNEGIYPKYYLSENLGYLKRSAELATRHGLVPGLLCFEPRSVPEEFFARYPMLRGARVDHPFRSFKPRYNMTIAHPLVIEHYQEMMAKLMAQVPELGFITIWTNDSGAGFEHTKSLYVGRNGGAYMIREWRDDAEIARLAGGHAIGFLRALRDAARTVNPDFRVITRLESFYGEHDVVWQGLGEGVEVETASLVARGWEMPYSHARYSDSKMVNGGTVYQGGFCEGEKTAMQELAQRDAQSHFYFAAGPYSIFAPLMGVPYPTLTHGRLKTLHTGGVRHLAHLGGSFPIELVSYNVNHEITRRFQYNPSMDIVAELRTLADHWTSGRFIDELLETWRLAEEAILAFSNITPLYSTMGFVWYRLWARPLVPNIEAIPEGERAYYEDFMCTTPHNPNNIDLSRDVLFQLTTAEHCEVAVRRIDENLWGPLDAAISKLASIREVAGEALGAGHVIEDQLIRLRALRCWFMTQRSVGAWITAVYGYMSAKRDSDRETSRATLRAMIDMEIENSRALLALLDEPVEFMVTTELGETPLVHGLNLKQLLEKRITLMARHRDDAPFIDPDYINRRAGLRL